MKVNRGDTGGESKPITHTEQEQSFIQATTTAVNNSDSIKRHLQYLIDKFRDNPIDLNRSFENFRNEIKSEVFIQWYKADRNANACALTQQKTKEKSIKQSGADFNRLKKEKVFEVIKRLLHEQGETEWFIDVSTTEFNLNGWAIENKEKLTEMYRCEFMNKEKFPRIEWKDRKPAIVPALGSRTLTKHQQRLREETRKID